MVLTNSGDAAQAKDVFQETIIAFYENVKEETFKGESAISTYLYSIARFKWLNQLKKDNVRTEHHTKASDIPHIEESAMSVFVENEKQAKVLEVLALLGDSCKKLLIASIYHNQSMKEIVAELNYGNEQVARNKKYKCIKSLKELIAARPNLLKILKAHD
jgi:RNA polymerase sigma factor (sigma-70 family)